MVPRCAMLDYDPEEEKMIEEEIEHKIMEGTGEEEEAEGAGGRCRWCGRKNFLSHHNGHHAHVDPTATLGEK